METKDLLKDIITAFEELRHARNSFYAAVNSVAVPESEQAALKATFDSKYKDIVGLVADMTAVKLRFERVIF